jgi:hypothetical protein
MAQPTQIALLADGQHLVGGVVGKCSGQMTILARKVLMYKENVHLIGTDP